MYIYNTPQRTKIISVRVIVHKYRITDIDHWSWSGSWIYTKYRRLDFRVHERIWQRHYQALPSLSNSWLVGKMMCLCIRKWNSLIFHWVIEEAKCFHFRFIFMLSHQIRSNLSRVSAKANRSKTVDINWCSVDFVTRILWKALHKKQTIYGEAAKDAKRKMKWEIQNAKQVRCEFLWSIQHLQ